MSAVATAIIAGPPSVPPEVETDSLFVGIFERCWTKDPKQRCSAADIVAALDQEMDVECWIGLCSKKTTATVHCNNPDAKHYLCEKDLVSHMNDLMENNRVRADGAVLCHLDAQCLIPLELCKDRVPADLFVQWSKRTLLAKEKQLEDAYRAQIDTLQGIAAAAAAAEVVAKDPF
jgi:hypothetical protein